MTTDKKMPSNRLADNKNPDSLCLHCGQALAEFLHEMEHHNAEVVCPSCGKPQEGDSTIRAREKTQKDEETDVHVRSSSPSSGKR